MLVLLFVALWFILRGDLLYVFPCVILFLCFSVLLVLRLPRLGKRELILVLFVRLFGLCLFRFVGFLFLLGLGRAAVCDCGTPWTFLLPFLNITALELRVRFLTSKIILSPYFCRPFQCGSSFAVLLSLCGSGSICGVCFAIVYSSYLLLLVPITKTCLYNFDPLKSHFYIVKLGFIVVVCIIFSYFCSKT